jgi:hypothetical protein
MSLIGTYGSRVGAPYFPIPAGRSVPAWNLTSSPGNGWDDFLAFLDGGTWTPAIAGLTVTAAQPTIAVVSGGGVDQAPVFEWLRNTVASWVSYIDAVGNLVHSVNPVGFADNQLGAQARVGLISTGGISIAKGSSAPAAPPAGFFYLYMDPADNKLKCKGSSGTVTILGNP